jgi:hypothetical protein
VVVFSSSSDASQQVRREAERAVSKGVIILPFRIEDIYPSGAMEYYLSTSHWLDALTTPLESHLDRLTESVRMLLENPHYAASSTERQCDTGADNCFRCRSRKRTCERPG